MVVPTQFNVERGCAMTTVRTLLDSKGSDIWSVSPETPVSQAIKVMAERRVGALMVCNEGHLVGIFTERDYIHRIALAERSPHATPIGEVMTDRVLYVRPEQKINECMALMTDKHVRHLPVLDEDHRVIGMVSIRDVIKDVIAEREFMIAQLENYITDRWV